MKFVNFRVNEEVRLGVKTDAGIIDVKSAAAKQALDVPFTIEEVIAAGQKGCEELAQLITSEESMLREDQISFAPSVTSPEKIICVGLNYISHRDECDIKIPETPVLFSKFNNALAAHQETINLPKTAVKFDYEAELVIIMGKTAANVSEEDALTYVFGYTIGNDFSARDLQFVNGQWLLGKSCDQFAPIGPYIVTADEIDPQNLTISCSVNGTLRQSANTRDMIFDVRAIISYISKHMTLKPGDIIFSGTPGGVILGYPEEQQVWLKAGDTVTVSIEKLGSLVNTLK